MVDAMTKAVDRWALDKHMAARTCTLGRADKRSTVWRIVMNGLVLISTEEGVKMPLLCTCDA